jgi:hypothetical protein
MIRQDASSQTAPVNRLQVLEYGCEPEAQLGHDPIGGHQVGGVRGDKCNFTVYFSILWGINARSSDE